MSGQPSAKRQKITAIAEDRLRTLLARHIKVDQVLKVSFKEHSSMEEALEWEKTLEKGKYSGFEDVTKSISEDNGVTSVMGDLSDDQILSPIRHRIAEMLELVRACESLIKFYVYWDEETTWITRTVYVKAFFGNR